MALTRAVEAFYCVVYETGHPSLEYCAQFGASVTHYFDSRLEANKLIVDSKRISFYKTELVSSRLAANDIGNGPG